MVFQNKKLPFNQSGKSTEQNFNLLSEILSGNLDFHDEGRTYASHNFHSFPAKFPPQLPKTFINQLTKPGDIVLDPMVGSGTTVLEGYLCQRKAVGFDIDPLALNITRVKTTPLNKDDLVFIGKSILDNANFSLQEGRDELMKQMRDRYDEPTRKFFDQWFLKETQLELFALVQEIEQIQHVAVRSFFEVCFSAIIITKSGGVSLALDLGHTRPHLAKKVIDRSGNILFGTKDEAPKYLTKIVRPVLNEFDKRVKQNFGGLIASTPDRFPTEIKYGNAQYLPLEDDSVDLIVTSPPYASNAIDYMRAHKFSLSWFGYSINDLGQKRKDYIGGEALGDFRFEELPVVPSKIVSNLREKDSKKSLVLHRYYSEMTRVLKEMYRVLRPQTSAVVVVGNSIMRGTDTETAECLAEIGRTIGFEVPRIGIRMLDRDKRMMPAGGTVNFDSQIQQRMHEEYVIGFYKPE